MTAENLIKSDRLLQQKAGFFVGKPPQKKREGTFTTTLTGAAKKRGWPTTRVI
jgi:hypothetical protein